MSITNTLFLFLFLPLALAVYHCSNDDVKEFVLLGVSLLFYALGCLEFFFRFLLVTGMVVCIGRGIAACPRRAGKRILLISGIGLNLCVLGYYKYTNFAIQTYNQLTGSAVEAKTLLLPLGISFFTFKAISYLADVYMGKAELTDSPLHDALYLTFFGHIQSGPLTRYSDLQPAADPAQKRRLFADGAFRFMIGFNKKILLANILSKITAEVFGTPASEFSLMYAWLGAVCFSMQLFFDFAGYSDMAIGISEMFGYPCMENFNFPYLTRSVSAFWRRWHISLSQWFRDYIYIPMGGSRVKAPRVYFNLLAVWVLTGIWHGASWNFVVWGLGYFAAISFERATGLPDRLTSKAVKAVYRILTLLFIIFEWVLFRAPSLRTGADYIRHMIFCPPNSLKDVRTLFLVKDYWAFLLAGAVLCFPVVRGIYDRLKDRKRLLLCYEGALGILVFLLFIWALSFVVSGQNNPFAYANF